MSVFRKASARLRLRSGKALITAVALLGTAVPFIASSTASAGVVPGANGTARSTEVDVAGFPTWYQDANGVRVTPCYDPNDPNCVAPVSATYDPAQPLAFPGNYPDELFYSAADSDLVVLPPANEIAVNCPTFVQAPVANPGVRIHMALEAAFLNGTLTPGDQMVFGRLRIVARAGAGLCPGTYYTFRTPYGPMTLQTDVNGEIQGAVASAATNDVGCLPSPAVPCDFNLALGAPVLGVGLLHQVNNAAPGYLGSGLGLDTVTGGKNGFNQFDVVRWPAGVTPSGQGVGIDCVAAGCAVIGTTNQFTVAAKLAGPLQADVATADFGGQTVGTTSAARSIVITNIGSGALGLDPTQIDHVAIAGTDAASFTLGTTDCSLAALGGTPVPLARDASCNVSVSFAPATAGVKHATLDVFMAGNATPFTVALTGSGIAAGDAPAATYTPADGNVDFGAVRLTTVGGVQNVVITNSGTAPLKAVPSILVAPGSAAFSIVANNCSAAFVAPGASCTVALRFIPSVVGPVTAILHVDTNLAAGAITFALAGHGAGGNAAMGPLNATNTLPDWYQDENGTRVGQCDDPANALCIATPIAGALSFPTNYPDEWFYYIASSAPIDVADCGLTPGTFFVEAGMESAFLGVIGPNLGTTFGRLRVIARGGGLCPNTEYLVTHPYGEVILATDANGNIKPKVGTTDVGCLGVPCDYSIALQAPVFEGFLVQDVRPDGYLGDPLAPGTVTGAPYTDPTTGLAANYVKIQRLDANGAPAASTPSQPAEWTTNQFGVSGRLVGPMTASPAAATFDSAAVAGGQSTKDITFTNEGIAPVTTTGVTIDGVAAADYTITADTCAPVAPATSVTLAVGATCVTSILFDPSVTGTRTARAVLHHSGRNNPLGVALSGIGLAAANSPAISTPLPTITFPDLQINQISASANVIVSNVGGNAPLIIGTTPKSGTNPGQFLVTNGCPGNNLARPGTVAPGATCIVTVRFAPTAAGAKTATLTINSNAGAITVNLSARGIADTVLPAQAAVTNAAGFPSWFQDDNGVRLEPCVAQDGNCVLLADASFNPALPVAWPSNWPGEFFYSLADSETVVVPADATCGGVGGLALVRLATEGSFPTLPPVAGAQITFNRIRVVASGLCPNSTYTFTHPYGQVQLTSDGAGDIKAKNGTFDNPNVVGSDPLSTGFLRWDPNAAPAAPTGYLGDPRVLHTVVGSRFRLPGAAEPVNYFAVTKANGTTVAQTDKFLLSGRTAGPVVASPSSVDLGVVQVGNNSATQTIVVSNLTNTAIAGGLSVTLGGTDAAMFSITNNGCTALNFAADGSCNVVVRFSPPLTATITPKSAAITITYGGLRSPVTVPLTGTPNPVQTPALTVTPTTLAFGSVGVGTTSATQILTIRNSGTGALRLGALSLGGTNPTQYRLVASSSATVCPINGVLPTANLAAGASCTVTVAFAPTASGSKPASLVVTATDRVTAVGHVTVLIPNVTVSLTGTGAQGTISLSASTLAVSIKAGTTGTVKVTLTNTGTAPFTLLGTPFYTVTAVSTNNPVPKFSAAQTGCNAVAPGKNCSVTVSFTPPLGTAVNTVFSVNIAMTSNATNNPVTVRVNGTSK